MKAQLLLSEDSLYLFLRAGKAETISKEIAKAFMMSFDDPKFYSRTDALDFKDFTTEASSGVLIAFVDDTDVLHVVNSEQFRIIFTDKEVKLLTVPEYAALHEKKSAIVRKLCLDGRIKGAIQKGTRWLIPEDSPYPEDERIRR